VIESCHRQKELFEMKFALEPTFDIGAGWWTVVRAGASANGGRTLSCSKRSIRWEATCLELWLPCRSKAFDRHRGKAGYGRQNIVRNLAVRTREAAEVDYLPQAKDHVAIVIAADSRQLTARAVRRLLADKVHP